MRFLHAALAKIGHVEKLETGFAGLPAFLSRADRVFGSDVWVYIRNSGTLLHTHCLRGSATDPKARFDSCAKKAAGAVVGRVVAQS